MKTARYLVSAIILLMLAARVEATTYPTCPTTPAGVTTDCTIGILVTSTATPVFAKITTRTYLMIQNLGYTTDSPPALSEYPVWCAIGTENTPTTSNSFVIQPGGVYQPTQIVRAQSPFTVPPGDISCIAPLGDVRILVEQEGG